MGPAIVRGPHKCGILDSNVFQEVLPLGIQVLRLDVRIAEKAALSFGVPGFAVSHMDNAMEGY